MQDDGTGDAQANDVPSLQFVALSLRDGLDADQFYHRGSGLGSSFWQRCRAAFAENGLHHVTAYNIWQDALRSLSARPDAETLLRERFLRALRTGQNDAIGYLPPRVIESLPVLIPAHAWDQCEIDWERAELQGAGFHFIDVRILISVLVFDRHHMLYNHLPITALAPFVPSDNKRKMLGIPVKSLSDNVRDMAEVAKASDAAKIGRTSRKDEILAAYHSIEKKPQWKDKELVRAIREHIMQTSDRSDDEGLGHTTILGHVGKMWRDFKRSRPAS